MLVHLRGRQRQREPDRALDRGPADRDNVQGRAVATQQQRNPLAGHADR